MTLTLPGTEPAAGPWRSVPLDELLGRLRGIGEPPIARPLIVAIDGRGAGGKSTLARALHAAVPRSTVVHTDDVAWNEPLFVWDALLTNGVLEPLRRGAAVSFRPPAWAAHDRAGTIEVPAGLELVIVEGVGAAQRALMPLIDAVVWVQSDFAEAERRGIARDIGEAVNGDEAETIAFWHDWMSAELEFQERERPWERADVVVCGTPSLTTAEGEVVLADGPLGGSTPI